MTKPPIKLWSKARMRWASYVALALLAVLFILSAGIYLYGYAVLKAWVESSAGQSAASKGLGNAIKVDGKFQPLHLKDWTIQTDSFSSIGWPGEAIGSFGATNIRIEVDPYAVFHRAWRIKNVELDSATIELVPPNDALKRPPVAKKPKPWYLAILPLPDHLECGPIVSDDTTLLYKFRDQLATIRNAHVEADLVGKDLKYTATSGTLEMPYLPKLRVVRLEMLVTHPQVTVYTAQFAGLDPGDPARVNLEGTIGMRANKSIDAKGEIIQLPIEQILPENLRDLFHGRASGKLIWKCDSTGKVIDSDGDLSFQDLEINNISVLKQLAALGGNEDLKLFRFQQAKAEFHLHGGRVTLLVRAVSENRFTMEGTVGYELSSKIGNLHVALSEIPIKTWLPNEMKPGAEGIAAATLQWEGRFDTVKESSGTLGVTLNGTQISTPEVLKILLKKKRIDAPQVISLKTGQFQLVYQNDSFELTQCDIVSPGIISFHLKGKLSPDKHFVGAADWDGIRIEDWLPDNIADEISASIQGHADLRMKDWRYAKGNYSGNIRLVDATLSYTPFQEILGRYFNDKELLTLPLTVSTFSWKWDEGEIEIPEINLRAGQRLGIKGHIHISPDRKLSGLLWVGIEPKYLKSMYGLGEGVFTRREDGLCWAQVNISGTASKPKQDFSEQIIAQIHKHPTSVFRLGLKLLSWYLGNWTGADKEWKRPTGD